VLPQFALARHDAKLSLMRRIQIVVDSKLRKAADVPPSV